MAINLSLNETQSLIQSTARDFFERNCPPAVVRQLEASEEGFSRDMWREMGELGFLGVTIPEQYGGSGGSFLDLYPLYLEIGRWLVPSPHLDSSVIAGESILAAGSEAQKAQLLPKIASGELIVSPAIMEPDGSYGAEGIAMRAARSGDAFVLNGTKVLVPFARSAGQLLVAVRTSGSDGPAGITLLLVDARAAGITREPLENIAGYPLDALTFADVRVPAANAVGAVDRGWDVLGPVLTRAAVLQAAMVVGAGERVLEMTANYAKDRTQFGQPIGRYQAVQYMVTDILLDGHLTKLLTLHAAWLIDQGFPHAREASMAKAAASKGAAHLMRQAHEVHAGVGFMIDHDLQLYSRRAKHWEWNLGDARYHYEQTLVAAGL